MKNLCVLPHIASRLDAAKIDDNCEMETFADVENQHRNCCDNCQYYWLVCPVDFCFYYLVVLSGVKPAPVEKQFDCQYFQRRSDI